MPNVYIFTFKLINKYFSLKFLIVVKINIHTHSFNLTNEYLLQLLVIVLIFSALSFKVWSFILK